MLNGNGAVQIKERAEAEGALRDQRPGVPSVALMQSVHDHYANIKSTPPVRVSLGQRPASGGTFFLRGSWSLHLQSGGCVTVWPLFVTSVCGS